MDRPGRVPWVWRALMRLSRVLVPVLCRLRVTGEVPARLRPGPLILAANHISPIDPVIVTAACHIAGVAPRFMATAGLFDAPLLGRIMRASHHLRVDRHTARVAEALPTAAAALRAGAVVLVYPEGRIGLDPWMWPERGKTGTARMAALSGAPVLAVAQWGSHEIMPYTAPKGLLRAVVHAMVHRPSIRVHFGDPVDLSGLTGSAGVQAVHATDRIIQAITDTLAPLRATEPGLPCTVDPTRPPDLSRIRRRPGAGD